MQRTRNRSFLNVRRILLLASLLLPLFVVLSSTKALAETHTVTSLADSQTDPSTLRGAIALAKPGDTIDFDQSLNGQRITLDIGLSEIRVNKNLTITAANLSNGIIIDGNSAGGRRFSVFEVIRDVSMHKLTITRGFASFQGGGGITNTANLDLYDCRIISNHASTSGGGIFNGIPGHLRLTRTHISNNSAFSQGGGIFVNYFDPKEPVLTITESVISQNTANNGFGGGIYTPNAIIINSVLSENSSRGGGAIYGGSYNSLTRIEHCTISNNEGWAPAIQANGNLLIKDCTFDRNRSIRTGNDGDWAIDCFSNNHDIEVRISHSTITNTVNAGAIYALLTRVTLEQVTITGNSFGAILNSGVGDAHRATMTINHCLIENNECPSGFEGGGITNKEGNLVICNTTIRNCRAPRGVGGGILNYSLHSDPACVTIDRTTISENSAVAGGGLYNDRAPTAGIFCVTVTNSTISGNTALSGPGGGIYSRDLSRDSRLSLTSTTVADNHAQGDNVRGGGLYSDGVLIRTELNNTIVAGNDDGRDFAPDISASVISQYCLVGKMDGSDGWGQTDLTGTIDDPLDPKLGVLANNGGYTKTHALLAGSPAINTGNPAFRNTTDQRGARRDSAPDRGAFEYGSLAPIRAEASPAVPIRP